MGQKAAVPSSLDIRLLGPFQIAVDGTTLEDRRWPRRKPKMLVKLLALQSQHQLHREQMMELLWPEIGPESASNNLHKIIYMARRALEPGLKSGGHSRFIITQEQLILLRAPSSLWIDVEAFEQGAAEAIRCGEPGAYEEALALYRGDLLTEDLYEEWSSFRRHQLRSLRQDLLTKLAQLYERDGQYLQSTNCLKEILASEPSNEDVHRQLMQLYARTGNRHQALRQFQQCCETVRKELDAEPEETTRQLYDRIVSGQVEPLARSATESAGERGDSIHSLAVLPFANTGADPNLEYLCEGITESIITSLSQLPKLRVMARASVFRYKVREADPQVVGRELAVRAVLLGRVAQLKDTLSIWTELVDARDGSHLWGEQYHRKLADIFAIQEGISQEISENLRLRLTGEEKKRMTKRYTESAEAYQLYLKGRYHWNKRTGEGLKKGIQYFQQAIEKDPGYALAYTGLADCYNLLSLYSELPPREAMPKAKAAALQALEIDDSLAEAHNSLAYAKLYYDWDWNGAEGEFRRALALNPNYAIAHHWYHEYLAAMGRFEESQAQILRAQELDPLSLMISADVGWGLYFARRYDEALEQLRKTLELEPNFVMAHFILGLTYLQKGQFQQSAAELQKAIALSGDSPLTLALGVLGHVSAASGRKHEAHRMLERLSALSRQRYVSSYSLAIIYTGLGEKDAVFASLRKACEERHDRLIYLNVEPIFDGIRADPRFRDLLRPIGLERKSSKAAGKY